MIARDRVAFALTPGPVVDVVMAMPLLGASRKTKASAGGSKTMEDQSSRSLHSLQVRAIPARPRRLRAGTVSSPISGLAR
jgi:hypothetical protein